MLNVVMLNLIITLIGATFGRISDMEVVATIKEKVDLIYENAYLMKWPFV